MSDRAWVKAIDRTYGVVEHAWEHPATQRRLATAIILLFLGSLAVIELALRGVIPLQVRSHFTAVELVFTSLLFIEVLGLVFGLVGSIANAMGKQIEILSLILLRQAFKRFAHFDEPLHWDQVSESVLYILSDAGGALLLFVLLGVYYRIQRHNPITADPQAKAGFIAIKKVVALGLILVFAGIGALDVHRFATGQATYPFFDTFYTVLVFADVLIVLVSLRYATDYAVVFRNSGFALATVLIRLALTAPPLLDAALGLAAAALVLGLTWAYNRFRAIHHDALAPPPGGLQA